MMLRPRWITACWASWAFCILALIQQTGGVPQQQQPVCFARNSGDIEAGLLQWPTCVETRWKQDPNGDSSPSYQESPTQRVTGEPSFPNTVSAETASTPAAASSSERETDQELDTDSPLDNVNFLSFEDWKKQNLAKAGQSAENIGGNRRAGSAENDRRRPTGISNALDSLGDDAEIELDFGGFGTDAAEAAKTATAWGAQVHSGEGDGAQLPSHTATDVVADASGQDVPQAGGERSKDAGTTCKERFNYASFDCAATVLKTNPQAQGSSSVLIENKDSYMLNECRAQNKFLILELCDDILVDTVVLANYEFFSSIFHTFRVSVADRYPAKPDQWKQLGIFEARNTREIQAFAVENPLIWARYLRIEFLTHYGNEFYCPLSLIRVHGTTMLEEYKHDGEARAEEEVLEQVAEPATEAENVTDAEAPLSGAPVADNGEVGILLLETCPNSVTTVEISLLGLGDVQVSRPGDAPTEPFASDGNILSGQASPSSPLPSTGDAASTVSTETGDTMSFLSVGSTNSTSDTPPTVVSSDTLPQNTTSDSETRSSSSLRDEQITEPARTSTTQPPPANPTTQESFFKSINKRLNMLESNSSLSLQYIEEQSRILRDAFNKVEKRQLSKTSTFLENLNVTVVNELKQFRDQYDQAWRSVALEFEHQRIQYHQEIHSLSTQLGVLADEIVFQKRVAVIQSIVVLLCLALVLFTRGAAGAYIDLPSVQNMVSRSYSLRSSSPIFGLRSPPGSPGSTRPTSSHRTTSGHRRQMSDDSQSESVSPTIAYAPPTPTSEDSRLVHNGHGLGSKSAASEDPRSAAEVDGAPQLLRSNSSPPDLGEENGEDGIEAGPGRSKPGTDLECSGFRDAADDALEQDSM